MYQFLKLMVSNVINALENPLTIMLLLVEQIILRAHRSLQTSSEVWMCAGCIAEGQKLVLEVSVL